ncbi:MAG: autotransporter domain-containing protein, partial [Desulfuromonadales bacterium]|nr:autotransporter domain-containing protein [Desulfuromonadales bacterium]
MAAVKKIFLCSLISVIIFTLGQTSGVNAQVLPPYQFIRLLTADVVNQELIDQGRATPQTLPFLENSQVTELSTAADGYYIRYYSYDPSRFQNGAVGGWMMPIPEVLGKSLPAVKDLFALPQAPDHFVVVKVPAGTLMRTGTSGPISGWGLGGGQQVLLMEYIDVSDYQTAAALPAAVRSGAFAPQAGGENAQNSATYIDSLAPDDPFSYLQIVRFSLSYLEGPAFDKALNNIGPECYDVLNRTGLEQGFMFEQILLDPASRNITSAPHGSYSMWGGITGSLASYDGRGEHTGFDLETGGAAAGFDLLLNPNLSVGLGLGCL